MKVKITRFDVNEGEIVLYAPDFQNEISISIDEIPYISEEQKQNLPVAVFEVIADGYKNAYTAGFLQDSD